MKKQRSSIHLFGPHELFLLIIIVGAILLRLVLIYLQWPMTNSDEGTMDLMALHIAYRGEHPIFFYGQDYMGPLEAYIGAALYLFFGISVFTVRLGLLPLFALFLICTYYLTTLLYNNKNFALLVVALLSLGSSSLVFLQLIAAGGYPEIPFLGTLIFLLASWLALCSSTSPQTAQQRHQRALLYGCWGFVVGFSLWIDQILLPYILTSACLLYLFCRRELRRWTFITLLSGLFIGLLPVIVHDLTTSINHNSLVTLIGIQQSNRDYVNSHHIPFWQGILGALLVSQPSSTGVSPSCHISEPLPRINNLAMLFGSDQALQCTVLQGSWSIVLLSLWIIGTFLTLSKIRPQWQQFPLKAWTTLKAEDKHPLVLQVCHLALLISAGLNFVLFAASPVASIAPRSSGRYLFCILISMPALLWPLWMGISKQKAWRASIYVKARFLVSIGLLAWIAANFLLGTIRIFDEVPNAQASFQQQEALKHDLLHLGTTRIYSDYWTCARLIFHSREQIICSALSETLRAEGDRYPPYQSIVKSAPHPAYVFPIKSRQATAIQSVLEKSQIHYQHIELDGYSIYYADGSS